MKLNPNNLKFKKFHKASASILYLKEQKVFFPLYGGFALKALESGKLTLKQMKLAEKALDVALKKKGVFGCVFLLTSL
jgi:hypothetical protein